MKKLPMTLQLFQRTWCHWDEDKLNLQNHNLNYIGAMGLKAAAKPEKSFFLQPVKWNRRLQELCSMYSFMKNGSFNHLMSLDISHNKFETLEGMNLHLLPRLKELDIRNNRFTDHLEVCSSLRGCHALKKIYVKSSLPGPFHNQKEYLNDMFLQMRGLDLIDNKPRPKAMYIKTFEKKAIEFLRIMLALD